MLFDGIPGISFPPSFKVSEFYNVIAFMLQNCIEVMTGELRLFGSFPPAPPRYTSYPLSFKRIQLLMIKADHKEIVEYIKISALCKVYM